MAPLGSESTLHTMQGHLLKNSGGKKADAKSVGSVRPRRSSFGNAMSKWEKRYFVLDQHSMLRYYKKEGDDQAKNELNCQGALLSVLQRDSAFCIETRDRVLSLRAESDTQRSAWICALLQAGAQDHPLAGFAAEALTGARPNSSVAQTCLGSSSAPPEIIVSAPQAECNHLITTRVPIPPGLSAGEQFYIQAEDGSHVAVTVPSSVGTCMDVALPMRVAEGIRDVTLPTQTSADSKYTLCRRLSLTLHKPEQARLGLAVAPSRSGHLIVTDIPHGGLIQQVAADFRLGDSELSPYPVLRMHLRT